MYIHARTQEKSLYKIADASVENVTRAHIFGKESKMLNYIHRYITFAECFQLFPPSLHTRNAREHCAEENI